ncbi:MAG: UDP-N-acetylmuramoyl-tripeptide--D-alanyl-D-alanine ligase [Candidatus Saganbacteria bacterium]|nr:UDP-N-acetylmuramoyl-tripeptide--D-alanyl-D-alanine ligase [Candidatus Saganbacteria bacterium]
MYNLCVFTIKEILEATKGELISGDEDKEIKGVSTDSRNFKAGSLFVPLTGKNFDGHKFIADAFMRGAAAALSSKKTKDNKNKTIIKVKDTEAALQDIALYHRKRFKVPIISVTGSSGKTTTKDMIAGILSEELKTLKSSENYNNEIGVPATLLLLDKTHKAAVLELAMQGLGEIEELARITLPDIAVITNIGEAHLKYLRSKTNIAKAKAEVLKSLRRNGFAVLPADDEYFYYLKKKARSRVITFGINNKADVFATDIRGEGEKISFTLNLKGKQFPVVLNVPGIHNVYNALASAAAAYAAGIKARSIVNGLQKFRPSSKRMEIFTTEKGIRVINDTYNANPSSMKAAIEVLKDQGPVQSTIPPRRIAVLGDMLELGKISGSAHRSIGELVARSGIEILITRGTLSKQISSAAKGAGLRSAYHIKTNESALKKLRGLLKPNDVVLLKGSRGMRMEEIADGLNFS